jgi:hypothetical protein
MHVDGDQYSSQEDRDDLSNIHRQSEEKAFICYSSRSKATALSRPGASMMSVIARVVKRDTEECQATLLEGGALNGTEHTWWYLSLCQLLWCLSGWTMSAFIERFSGDVP